MFWLIVSMTVIFPLLLAELLAMDLVEFARIQLELPLPPGKDRIHHS